MFGMELWFIFAVSSAVIGGFGAFGNKIAAQRKYSSELVTICSSMIALLLFAPFALLFEPTFAISFSLVGISFVAGLFSSSSNVMKIQVLHHIDSAIFLPIFKVVSPLIVIFSGVLIFSESFTKLELLGLAVSLTVPLLLITKAEHARQNNLPIGIVLILITGVTSAIAASLQKFATDLASVPLWILLFTSLGVLMGSSIQYYVKNRSGLKTSIQSHFSYKLLQVALLRTVFATGGFYLTLLAFVHGGPLGIVYTINSLYILAPIVLAVIFYNEHWNLQKVTAIALSILALGLLR